MWAKCAALDFSGSDESAKNWKKDLTLATEQDKKSKKSITEEWLAMRLCVLCQLWCLNSLQNSCCRGLRGRLKTRTVPRGWGWMNDPSTHSVPLAFQRMGTPSCAWSAPQPPAAWFHISNQQLRFDKTSIKLWESSLQGSETKEGHQCPGSWVPTMFYLPQRHHVGGSQQVCLLQWSLLACCF